MTDSFDHKLINLRERLRPQTRKASNEPLEDKQDKGGQTAPSTPQEKGQESHRMLANLIKEGRRDGTRGKMLKEIENEFHCEFIKAEVYISGYGVTKKTYFGSRFLDFWSGKMDAVAFRESGEDVLEVFVVDWKTTDQNDPSDPQWWANATNFKIPLYQCLVYRELLQAHLKRSKLKANVGIILVPIHQNDLELSRPGLCVDFERMDEMRLLDKLKDFQWLPDLDDSVFVYTIKLPCKLFKESFDPADGVHETTSTLKGDTRLKDIFSDNATVADLRQVLDLPFLKVKGIKEEETKAQKDDKTSAIGTAAATEDKTNEELEEANKKKKASGGSTGEARAVTSSGSKRTTDRTSKVRQGKYDKTGTPLSSRSGSATVRSFRHREAQDVTGISPKTTSRVKDSKKQ